MCNFRQLVYLYQIALKWTKTHQYLSEIILTNLCEVIRAGLRLLEEEENKVIALKQAIQEGIAHDLDPKAHLEALKAKKHLNG